MMNYPENIVRDGTNSIPSCRILLNGYTLIEVLCVIAVITVAIISGEWVAKRADINDGIYAGVCAGLVISCVMYCILMRIGTARDKDRRAFEEKYSSIFRVVKIPSVCTPTVVAEGAGIEVGDFGWEAEPMQDDGRIYLQGLSKDWHVVWYAGFGVDEVERVGRKPRSQYYLPYEWISGTTEATPCPFPVTVDVSTTCGYPIRQGVDENGQYYLKAKAKTDRNSRR